MSTEEVSCAAQKSLQEAKNRLLNSNSPVFAAQHQNIAGVIVPTSATISPIVPIVTSAPQIQARIPSQKQFFPGTVYQESAAPDTAPTIDFFSPDNPAKRIHTEVMGSLGAETAGGGTPSKMHVSKSALLYTLNLIREPVVDYQETRGIPRNEEITFVTLVTSLCTQAYTAAITILVMLWNLMPLVDGLVYFVRFFLDKIIDIVETSDNKDRFIKGAILFAELTVVFFIIFMIVGLIFMPVYQLMARLFSKVFSMVAW